MPSFDRRTVIVGALAAVSLPRIALAALPPSGSLHFNILRNGKPFGRYQVVFTGGADAFTATTDVAMNARIAGVTVFDYKHHCEETWRGGKFMEMHSNTVRDNQAAQTQTVNAVRGGSGISITNKAGISALSPAATPLTHWNQANLGGPLFNPEDGYPLSLSAQQVGHDGVVGADGKLIPAGTHWALRGAQQIDEWYDAGGVWAGLNAVFPDKSIIDYRRI